MIGLLRFRRTPGAESTGSEVAAERSVDPAAAALAKVGEVLEAAARGDLERRVLDIEPDDPHAPIMHALNHLLDLTDAYVRETRACLEAAGEGRFHRIFLDRGMRGGFGDGAAIISETVRRMEAAAREAAARDEEVRRVRERERQAAAQAFRDQLTPILEAMSETARNLDAIARDLTGRMKEVIESGEIGATVAQENLQGAQAVAAGAEQLRSAIEEIARQAADSDAAVRQVRADVGGVVESTRRLEEATEAVGKVVAFIRDIAEQTNLLALNATIEAARAGEAGRGFAVVASEVKALANQTSKATDEIAKLIGAMESAARETAQAIDSIDNRAERVAQVVSAIAAAVEEQAAATGEISKRIEGTTGQNERMSQEMERVKQASRSGGDAAQQLLAEARSMSERVAALEEAANAFLRKLREE